MKTLAKYFMLAVKP